ncbi:hypothetical protein Tco_0993078 [Tanacetum coccineum]|uniref:RNA-directed DNA polymerase, eukaryota n=1 Tax=Tanacetum coccineum TaxID=301880 RepID=A0ABQ5F516_9ASTR
MPVCNSFVSDERIVWISVEGLPINSWTTNTFSRIASKWGDLVIWEESDDMTLSCKHLCLKTKVNSIINGCFKIIIKGKVHWVRAKELDAWIPKLISDEECDSSDDDESTDSDKILSPTVMEFDNSIAESDVEKVSESSFSKENNFVQEETQKPNCEDPPQSSDPFHIYDLLNKKKTSIPQTNTSDPTYPPGFTPDVIQNEGESAASVKSHASQSFKSQHNHNSAPPPNRNSIKPNSGGSFLEFMDDLVKIGRTMGYNMDGCLKNMEDIIGAQGELNVIK